MNIQIKDMLLNPYALDCENTGLIRLDIRAQVEGQDEVHTVSIKLHEDEMNNSPDFDIMKYIEQAIKAI